MPYIILVILVLMFVYALSGYIGWQRAVVNTLCFGLCIYAIPMLVNAGISLSNNLTDSFYRNKFTYWALVQHQAYQEDLEEAVSTNSYDDYLVTLFEQQGFENNSHVVNMRWMCPKKDNFLVNIESEFVESTNSPALTKLLRGVLNSQLSGEDYTKSANKTYLYRSYTDIASYAEHIYKNIGVRGHLVNGWYGLYEVNGFNSESLGNYLRDYISVDDLTALRTNLCGSLDRSELLGFNFDTGLNEMANTRFFYFNRSNSILDSLVSDLDNVSPSYDAYGVPTSKFNFTLADFNSSQLMSSESASLGVFAIFSESPYYYLNWNIRDQLYSRGISGEYPIKSLLLADTKGLNSYFFNTSSRVENSDSYGQLRDFMDMRSLFSVVVPYLKECNDVVVAFDEAYGLKMTGDIKVTYTTDANGNMTLDIPPSLRELTESNKDEFYKYWHDVQVANLFNMYTPWVDTLYSCSYAKPETITVAGDSYVVLDPLNPASYPEGRPMVFSESERLYYGLSMADLTKVERKILSFNQSCYNSLLSLMNYYSFKPEVLISAMSILETFEFNKEFSEVPFIGDSNVLYPQNFELKNFSFDAYFRLILSETTGLDLNSSESIYKTVVDNTSVFTAVLILFTDLTAVWGVPFLRLFVVVFIFLMIIICVLSSCVAKEGNNLDFKELIKNLGSSVVSPLISYILITVSCAWLVSLFLSSGYTGITGKLDFTISLGDPVLAIVALLVINCVLVVVYVILFIKMFKSARKQVGGIKASVSAVAAGLGALGLSAIGASKADGGTVSNTSAPSGGGASKVLKPKLKTGGNASNKLAKKELADRRNEKIKSGAKKVKDVVTKPVRSVNSRRKAKKEAVEAQEAKKQADEKLRAEREEYVKLQAEANAKALLDEQERRDAIKRAEEKARREEEKARRDRQVAEGMRLVRQKNSNSNSNNNFKGKKSKHKGNTGRKGGKVKVKGK